MLCLLAGTHLEDARNSRPEENPWFNKDSQSGSGRGRRRRGDPNTQGPSGFLQAPPRPVLGPAPSPRPHPCPSPYCSSALGGNTPSWTRAAPPPPPRPSLRVRGPHSFLTAPGPASPEFPGVVRVAPRWAGPSVGAGDRGPGPGARASGSSGKVRAGARPGPRAAGAVGTRGFRLSLARPGRGDGVLPPASSWLTQEERRVPTPTPIQTAGEGGGGEGGVHTTPRGSEVHTISGDTHARTNLTPKHSRHTPTHRSPPEPNLPPSGPCRESEGAGTLCCWRPWLNPCQRVVTPRARSWGRKANPGGWRRFYLVQSG